MNLPTHVFVQAGVGSFAAAMVASLTSLASGKGVAAPAFFVVEPEGAPCLFESIKKGEQVRITGDMATIMAGLSCGEPSLIVKILDFQHDKADLKINAFVMMTIQKRKLTFHAEINPTVNTSALGTLMQHKNDFFQTQLLVSNYIDPVTAEKLKLSLRWRRLKHRNFTLSHMMSRTHGFDDVLALLLKLTQGFLEIE
jgi:hypothetical protein